MYNHHGWFRKHGHQLGLLLARKKNSEYEYFDSYGLLPPKWVELPLKKLRKKSLLHNDNQLQWVRSVRCHYYCLLKKQRRAMFFDMDGNGKSRKTKYFSWTYDHGCERQAQDLNVKGTEKVVLTKNKHRKLKVICAVCGIIKTRFLPGNLMRAPSQRVLGYLGALLTLQLAKEGRS